MKIPLRLIFIFFTLLLRLGAEEPVDEQEVSRLLGEAYSITSDYPNAEKEYETLLQGSPQDDETRIRYADLLSWQKKYPEAIEEYKKILLRQPAGASVMKKLLNLLISGKRIREAGEILDQLKRLNPADPEISRYHADILSCDGQLHEAIAEYETFLQKNPDPEVMKKLADVLSWTRQYEESLKRYDQVLAQTPDFSVMLQKARVLGWARKYGQSLSAYEDLIEKKPEETFRMEMEAKTAYWNKRFLKAADLYEKLLEKDPENLEAAFDLSQIYYSTGQSKKARIQFQKILALSPGHFRAREGLEKSDLMRHETAFLPGYEYYTAKSTDRLTDVERQEFSLFSSCPVFDDLSLQFLVNSRRYDYPEDTLTRQLFRQGLAWRNPPWWGLNLFYTFSRDINAPGGALDFRIWDLSLLSLSWERSRMDHSFEVMRRKRYSDDLHGRLFFPVCRNLDAGIQCGYSEISDSNLLLNPEFFIELYFSREPAKLSVEYRLDRKEYDFTSPEYFSPPSFTTQYLFFRWKHFLNENEFFSGSDNLYYAFSPALTYDSDHVSGYLIEGEAGWDVNKKWNIRCRAKHAGSESGVYRETQIQLAAVLYT